MDEVVGIDVRARQVALASGAKLPYDYLVLATGATHSYFGHEEWAPLAPGLKSIEDAIEIRRRVLLAFELAERADARTRLASAAQLRRHRRRPHRRRAGRRHQRHCPALHAPRLPPHRSRQGSRAPAGRRSPRVLAAYPPDLSAKAEAELARLGVEVHTNTQVTGVGPGWVEAKRQAHRSRRHAVGRRRSGLAAGQDAGRARSTAAAASSSTTGSIRPACPRSSFSATWPTSSRTATRFPASPSPPCRWATTSAR